LIKIKLFQPLSCEFSLKLKSSKSVNFNLLVLSKSILPNLCVIWFLFVQIGRMKDLIEILKQNDYEIN